MTVSNPNPLKEDEAFNLVAKSSSQSCRHTLVRAWALARDNETHFDSIDDEID